MAVINSTENPYTFTPTGNAVVRPIFSATTSGGTCQSYKIQTTEANLTQFGGQINPTINVRYTACGQFPESPTITLRRTGIPIGNSVEYAATICSSTTPEVFTSGVSVSPPSSNTSLCASPPPPQTTLTIRQPTNTNSGTVAAEPGAILTGTPGRDVTVRATPASGFRFVGWVTTKNGVTTETNEISVSSFNSLQVNVDVDTTISAKFETIPPQTTTLTTQVTPTAGGTIQLVPADSATGVIGRKVRVTAVPETNYRFTKLTILKNGQSIDVFASSTYEVTVDANTTVTATFEQQAPPSSTLTITANPSIVTLRRASSITVPLTVNATNVTNTTLSVSGLPAAITHTFAGLNSITFSNNGQTIGPITATITATGTSATGQTITATATVTIRGTYITRLVPSPASNGRVSTSAQVAPDAVTGIIEIESTQEGDGVAGAITFTATPNGGSYTFGGWFLDSNLTTPWSQVALQNQIPVTQNRTYTAKFISAGGTDICTPPPLNQRERTVPVSCPTGQVGTASQRQIRTYNATVSGSGTCPFTSDWQNSGQPDYSQCTTQQFWRNCVTGQQVEGTPPTGYISKQFTGAAGGICWEQPGDIDFIPSLAQALQFTYQRGTSRYPETRTVDITNRSESFVQQVNIQTNSKVNLAVGTSTGAGSISFTIPPRGTVTLRVSVTPQLLQELQDGVSTLGMSIQYQAVN